MDSFSGKKIMFKRYLNVAKFNLTKKLPKIVLKLTHIHTYTHTYTYTHLHTYPHTENTPIFLKILHDPLTRP